MKRHTIFHCAGHIKVKVKNLWKEYFRGEPNHPKLKLYQIRQNHCWECQRIVDRGKATVLWASKGYKSKPINTQIASIKVKGKSAFFVRREFMSVDQPGGGRQSFVEFISSSDKI